MYSLSCSSRFMEHITSTTTPSNCSHIASCRLAHCDSVIPNGVQLVKLICNLVNNYAILSYSDATMLCVDTTSGLCSTGPRCELEALLSLPAPCSVRVHHKRGANPSQLSTPGVIGFALPLPTCCCPSCRHDIGLRNESTCTVI